MSKFDLSVTAEDLKGANSTREAESTKSNIIQYLRTKDFSVGDVLVAKCTYSDRLLTARGSNNIVRKFVVVHKTDEGLVYCKTILSQGGLSSKIELIATYHDSIVFSTDPDQVDAIIFGDEEAYDAAAQAKRAADIKNQVRAHNKKIVLPISRLNTKAITSLKPGDDLYVMTGWIGHVSHCKVVSVRKEPLRKTQGYWDPDTFERDAGLKSRTILEVRYTRGGSQTYTSEYSGNSFDHFKFFKVKPRSTDDELQAQ